MELVELVESGRLTHCRAIDTSAPLSTSLGCGSGDNVIYLAHHGFEAVGVNLSPGAIAQAQAKAQAAGVVPPFLAADVTDIEGVEGPFDLVVDYGCLGSVVGTPDRELYVQNVLTLTHAGSCFLLYCFEWEPRWWERPFFFNMACEPGEIKRRFGSHFKIERYAKGTMDPRLIPGWAVYLMTRKER
jgi:cyclopropane fatty-acyl-phospholipid synthase-like methyltransferase